MITTLISFDVANELIIPVSVKAGDRNSRSFKFTLVNEGVPVNLTGVDVQCRMQIDEHTQIVESLTVDIAKAGVCTLVIPDSFSNENNQVDAELLLYNSNILLSTYPFKIGVIESIAMRNGVPASSLDELRALEDALMKADSFDDKLQDISDDVEQLSNRINSNTSSISSVNNSINSINSQLTTINNNIEELKIGEGSYINLASLASNGVVNRLELENRATYYVSGTDQITIKTTSFGSGGSDPFVCYFVVASSEPSASLTISGTNGKIFTQDYRDFIIKGNTHPNIMITCSRPYGSESQEGLRLHSPLLECNKRIRLNTLYPSGSVISDFAPIHGALYTAGGNEQYTINGIQNAPDGIKFYLGLFTESSIAYIRLEDGKNISSHDAGYEISVATGRQDIVIEVVKFNDTNFRVKGW